MDDIYRNLENYDEGNTITELRSENKDLKIKLEEYATALDKLQKDFDNLATEFKKLEYNYSSLLKTARLEIERKTKIITNLNIEKDMMVLNSVQNVNSRNLLYERSSVTNDIQGLTEISKEVSDSNTGKPKMSTKQLKGCQKLKHDFSRIDGNKIPSEDVVTSSNTDITNRLLSIANKGNENIGSGSDRNSESKENLTHIKCDYNGGSKPRALLKNRRKSMPVDSLGQEKFSPNEDHPRATETLKKDFASRTNKTFVDGHCSDKQSNKISHTSNMDDKHSTYSDSSRDMRKSKSTRYENDRYKSRDKCSQRYKRHFSPERLHRKGPRDYQEDHFSHRSLVSPPHDKFNNYYHKNRDHRPDYERSHTYDYEKFRHRHQERLAIKHKIPSDYEEPNIKKMKSDSFKRQNEDITRWHYDVEVKEKQAIETFEFLEDTSCQSPDYIHSDAQSMIPIREIKHTAVTQLEDPRKTNNKYLIKKSNDGKVVLSTVIGRNVDMKTVNKSEWGINSIDVPNALVQEPLQMNEEIVKEIYMDIDIENPILNSSLESGEIGFDSEQVAAEIFENNENNRPQINDNNKNLLEPTKFAKYRIPKVNTEIRRELRQENLLNVKTPPSYDFNKNSREQKTNSTNNLSTSQRKLSDRHETTHNKNRKQVRDSNFQCQNPVVVTREIVEGDLALSDDTSDYADFQGHITKQISIQVANDNAELHSPLIEQAPKEQTDTLKEIKLRSANGNTKKTNCAQLQEHITNIKNQTDSCNERNNFSSQVNPKKVMFTQGNEDAMIESTKNPEAGQNTVIEKKIEQEECAEVENFEIKKPKGKKKSQKFKENNSKTCLEVMGTLQETDKKTTSKKDKVTKLKEIKNKFNDLFGDSSSLITPEDLGVVAQQGSSLPAPDYIPIFEDTDDTIDTFSMVKEKTAMPLMSEKLLSETDNKMETKENESSKDFTCKNKSSVIDQNMPVPIEIAPASIYSNLLSGTSCKDTDVVKTVILSTGVQPQCDLENSVLHKVDKPKANLHQNEADDDRNKNDIRTTSQKSLHIDALATSTPQKVLQHCINTDTISDSSCNSNMSRVASSDNVIHSFDHSDNNKVNSLNDTDVPDVRIISQSFYRRRRKVIKKT